jgi:hypothetical protein
MDNERLHLPASGAAGTGRLASAACRGARRHDPRPGGAVSGMSPGPFNWVVQKWCRAGQPTTGSIPYEYVFQALFGVVNIFFPKCALFETIMYLAFVCLCGYMLEYVHS